MTRNLTTIGLDADDTLWHNERFFRMTEARFLELLAPYVDSDAVETRMLDAERRNLGRYGFGVKGFVLSMIETAIEVTEQQVPASVIAELIAAGHEMLQYPIELLPHVRETVRALADSHCLVLVTKGDLIDQERKLAQSGLGDWFDAVEIVSDKTRATYEGVFARHGDGAERAMMVGDSLRSDVVPAIEAGGWGVHVPQGEGWVLERAPVPRAQRYRCLDDLSGLTALVREIG